MAKIETESNSNEKEMFIAKIFGMMLIVLAIGGFAATAIISLQDLEK